MIDHLLNVNQAEKYAEQESAIGGRDFLKKIGSKFRIADRTLACDFKNAFKIAGKYHRSALGGEATPFNFAECKTWRCLFENIRTELSGPRLACPTDRREPERKACPVVNAKRSTTGGRFSRHLFKIFRRRDPANDGDKFFFGGKFPPLRRQLAQAFGNKSQNQNPFAIIFDGKTQTLSVFVSSAL